MKNINYFLIALSLILAPTLYSREIYNIQSNSIRIYEHNEALLTRLMPLGDFKMDGEYDVMKHFIRDNDIVFDAGANEGYWTSNVFFMHQPEKIYAFEPIPTLVELFNSTTKHLGNVELCTLALSNKTELDTFYYYTHEFGVHSSLYDRPRVQAMFNSIPLKVTVQKVTLDEFCSERSITHIDFLKIDTEGAEFDILKGANELLKKHAIKHIQFEYGQSYYDTKILLKDVLKYLCQHNYVIFKIHPESIVHVAQWTDSLEDFYQSNFLAIASENAFPYKTISW